MREILFRGKRKDNGEWIEGFYVKLPVVGGYNYLIYPKSRIFGVYLTPIAVDPETIGQYTDLTDKNGIKIFEGDIVSGVAYSSVRQGVIVWIDEIAAFGIRYQTGSGKLRDEPTAWQNSSILTAIKRWKTPNEFQAEVIGNIHDNPKLLEVKE